MSPQNPAIDPRRTALLIMDYQPAILGGLNDHDQLLTLASGAIGLARQAGITVAYVRVAFADQDYEQVPEANKMLAGVARSRALPYAAPRPDPRSARAPARRHRGAQNPRRSILDHGPRTAAQRPRDHHS